jgi:sulfur relay protein TusB/DsrH
MTVYLVSEQFYDDAVQYASKDKEAKLVFLEDAVYCATKTEGLSVHVIRDDATRRGLVSKIPSSVKIITYDDLVQMIETEKIVNFL